MSAGGHWGHGGHLGLPDRPTDGAMGTLGSSAAPGWVRGCHRGAVWDTQARPWCHLGDNGDVGCPRVGPGVSPWGHRGDTDALVEVTMGTLGCRGELMVGIPATCGGVCGALMGTVGTVGTALGTALGTLGCAGRYPWMPTWGHWGQRNAHGDIWGHPDLTMGSVWGHRGHLGSFGDTGDTWP